MEGRAGRLWVLSAGLLLLGAAGLVDGRGGAGEGCERTALVALVAGGEARLGCPRDVEQALRAALERCGRPVVPVTPGERLRLDGCEVHAEPWPVGHARLLGKQVSPDTFTAADWERLPGIGPALARRIMDERRRAPFGSWEGLDRVRGIGPARVAELRSRFDAVRR